MRANNRPPRGMGAKDRTRKSLSAIFKPWIVKRPGHECQVLFPLTELDRIADECRKQIEQEGAS